MAGAAGGPGGVGAVRCFQTGRIRSVEEVVAVEPDHRFAYELAGEGPSVVWPRNRGDDSFLKEQGQSVQIFCGGWEFVAEVPLNGTNESYVIDRGRALLLSVLRLMFQEHRQCFGLTVDISVTGADERSGQLAVVEGPHRALVRPAAKAPTASSTRRRPRSSDDRSTRDPCATTPTGDSADAVVSRRDRRREVVIEQRVRLVEAVGAIAQQRAVVDEVEHPQLVFPALGI